MQEPRNELFSVFVSFSFFKKKEKGGGGHHSRISNWIDFQKKVHNKKIIDKLPKLILLHNCHLNSDYEQLQLIQQNTNELYESNKRSNNKSKIITSTSSVSFYLQPRGLHGI